MRTRGSAPWTGSPRHLSSPRRRPGPSLSATSSRSAPPSTRAHFLTRPRWPRARRDKGNAMTIADDPTTFGRTRLSFADAAEIDDFVTTLERFEQGDITPDQWRAYRLVRG